jgi:hypothetical protein
VTTSPFDADVVAAITRHMNGDHAEDNVVICKAFGSLAAVSRATNTGFDESGMRFTAVTPTGEVEVVVPWAQPIVERSDVRAEVVRMYAEAAARLGLEAPGH